MSAGHGVEMDGLLRLDTIHLPFPMEVVARRGCHRIAGVRRAGALNQGESVQIGRYRPIRYTGPVEIDPRIGYELHLRIFVDSNVHTLDASGKNALAALLARAVFLHPAQDWSMRSAAGRFGLKPGRLAAQLLRENSALSSIVREQRAMRALLILLARRGFPRQVQASLARAVRQSGFANLARLDAAFVAQFGLSATRVAALSWYPALTWAFVADDGRAPEGKPRAGIAAQTPRVL